MTNVLADQTGSLLLSKLPVELRCLIWEYAIGRQHLHIIRKKAKFRHISCHPKIWKLNGSATPFSPSVPFLNGFTTSHMQPWSVCTSPYSLSADDQLATWSMLSLLCTCQQIHSEAIEIMYSTNTFLFSSPFVITNFFLNHTLLSYRNLIRTITISIGAPESTPRPQGGFTFVTDRHIQQNLVAGAWDSIHSTLETFSNLRTVQIFIPDQRSSLSNMAIIQRDYGDLNNRIFQFFTYHKTKSALKNLEIYIPFMQITEDGNDYLTLNHDPAGHHYATELQGQLNAEGVACTVVDGGILTLGEQLPTAVK